MSWTSEQIKYLSRHIDRFACQGDECCGGELRVHPMVIAGIVRIQRDTGITLTVTSCYRCAKHNAGVRGNVLSRHLDGYAVDVVYPVGGNPTAITNSARLYFRGVKHYPERRQFHLQLTAPRDKGWRF